MFRIFLLLAIIVCSIHQTFAENEILFKTKNGEWVSGVLVQQNMTELTIQNGNDTQKYKVADLSVDDKNCLKTRKLGAQSMQEGAPIRDAVMSIDDIYAARQQVVGHVIKVNFNFEHDFKEGAQDKNGTYIFQCNGSFEKPAIIEMTPEGYKALSKMNRKDLNLARGEKSGTYIYVKVTDKALRNQFSGDGLSGLVLKCVGRRIVNGQYAWVTKDEEGKLKK